MLVIIGLPVITKRTALHRHPPPCRSNMGQSMKSVGEGVKSATWQEADARWKIALPATVTRPPRIASTTHDKRARRGRSFSRNQPGRGPMRWVCPTPSAPIAPHSRQVPTTTPISGEANLDIPISGPRGSGTIAVRASKSDGKWRFSSLNVLISGRSSPLDLLAATPP